MQNAYDEIKSFGAGLVAISPQQEKYSKQIKSKHDLDFDILIDEGNKSAEEFGLKFALPDYLIEVYKGFGTDLGRFNGDPSWTLPMPARYVVNGNGIVAAADFDPDYTHRPEPQKTIEDLKKLSR